MYIINYIETPHEPIQQHHVKTEPIKTSKIAYDKTHYFLNTKHRIIVQNKQQNFRISHNDRLIKSKYIELSKYNHNELQLELKLDNDWTANTKEDN